MILAYIFLAIAIICFIFELGILPIKWHAELDVLNLTFNKIKLVVRISPITMCLALAYIKGFDALVYKIIPISGIIWVLIIFIVFPSIFETIKEITKKPEQ